MEKEKEIIKWNNMSNASIKHELEGIKEYHSSLKIQISKLLDKINELEKEYLLGNNILENRQKGIE